MYQRGAMYQLRTPGSADRCAESEGRWTPPSPRLWFVISSFRSKRQRRHYAVARSRLEAAQFAGTRVHEGVLRAAIMSWVPACGHRSEVPIADGLAGGEGDNIERFVGR